MLDLFDKMHPFKIYQENNESQIACEQIIGELNQNLTFNSTNEKYLENNIYFLLNKKRKKNFENKKVREKHTKFSCDNLKRTCKHLVVEYVMKFINKKIFEVYGGYIDNGLLKKQLFKLNQSQKTNADVEFNKIFINKSLKDILSQNITKQITLYEPEHNKKVIDKIII